LLLRRRDGDGLGPCGVRVAHLTLEPAANEAVVVTEPGDFRSGVAPYALDPNDADRLWDETARLLRR
jgi:hypothetical protein